MRQRAIPATPQAPLHGTAECQILAYLKTGHSLDAAKAVSIMGYCRLSSAIHKLRLKGWPILTQRAVAGPLQKSLTTYVLPSKVSYKLAHSGKRARAQPLVYQHGMVNPLVVRTNEGCMVHVHPEANDVRTADREVS
jgi:hypothetical protein